MLLSHGFSPHNITLSSLILAVVFSLGACYFDVKYRKIPNKYNLGFFILSLILNAFLAFHRLIDFTQNMLGCMLGFSLLFLPFMLKMGGAGDVKLLTVLGFILGLKHFVWVFILTSIISVILVIPFIVNEIKIVLIHAFGIGNLRDKILEYLTYVKDTRKSRLQPYAVSVCLGCIVYLFLFAYTLNMGGLLKL